jgi:hypothetical protein
LYYLHRDPELVASGKRLPRSTRTVWRLLREAHLLPAPRRRERVPFPERAPLEEVQVDLKDASGVPADPDGKRQHVIEVCNFVDAGTSILLDAQVHPDFHAETALQAVVQFFGQFIDYPLLCVCFPQAYSMSVHLAKCSSEF